MFNYESLFLIYDYLINESNKIDNKLKCGINISGTKNNNYKLIISFHYMNKICQKNKWIENINNNKFLLNLAFINKFCYNIYDTCIIKCYSCKIPLINNKIFYGTSNYLVKNIKKSCNNKTCKLLIQK